MSLDMCSVEAGKWVPPSSHHTRQTVDRCAPTVEAPPGLIMQNRFQELCGEQESEGEDEDTCTGDYFDIGGPGILMPDEVNGVGGTGMLVLARPGKVAKDSGAAESVGRRDILQAEAFVEGAPKKSGV